MRDRDAYVRSYEFVRPVQVINFTTGAWMPFEGEIHQDDVRWLVDLLNEGWALDWELDEVERADYTSGRGRTTDTTP